LPRDWVFPIVLACFVAVVVWFGHQIRDFLAPPVDAVTVPSFIGEAATDAIAAAKDMNLSAEVIDHGMSDRYPKGVVMMQQPQAGSSVRAGRQVSFVVSDGMVAHLMPDLRYQSMREVNLDLTRAKLQLGTVTYVKSDIVPVNHVIDQDPAPLANVSEGDKVNLTMSKGGAAFARVPEVTGMSIDGARAAAEKAGLTLGQVVWTPLGKSGPAHGIVARQSIPPGTKIAPFQALSLQVSAGPNESGYLLRQVRVLASIPEPENFKAGESVKVDLRVRDATGSYDAYRAYAQPGQKLDFTVTALGTSVVDLYVDDVLVGETRLGAEPKAVYDEKATPSPSPGP
jgi:eukaryotic-like serine/threonine-protein kinase